MGFLRSVFDLGVALVLSVSILWGAMAMWFKLPVPETLNYLVIGIFCFVGILAVVHVFTHRTRRSLLVYAVMFAALLIWWQSLRPPAEGDWAPDVARQVTGVIDGDQLTLTDVRAFEWRSNDDFTEVWTTRSYDLSKLQTADLFLSYWGDPKMAHFILSFGFEGGDYLAWSVEVRRLRSGGFSPIADFFKANPLVIVAAAETDVVGVRSNVRGEDVHLFRLATAPERSLAVLKGYVADANALAAKPVWYNSITTNCTTVVFKTMEALGLQVPFDWRMIVNGYLPEMAYDFGVVNTDYSVEELRALGLITENALAAGLGDTFSQSIRVGVPQP